MFPVNYDVLLIYPLFPVNLYLPSSLPQHESPPPEKNIYESEFRLESSPLAMYKVIRGLANRVSFSLILT